jgi:hypothetical protein
MAGQDTYAQTVQAEQKAAAERERVNNLRAISQLPGTVPAEAGGAIGGWFGPATLHSTLSPEENAVVGDITKSMFGQSINPQDLTPKQWQEVQADARWRGANRPIAVGDPNLASNKTQPSTLTQLGVQATLGNDLSALMTLFFPTMSRSTLSSLDAQALATPTPPPAAIQGMPAAPSVPHNPYLQEAQQMAQSQGQSAINYYDTFQLPAESAATQSILPATLEQNLLNSIGYQMRYGNVLPSSNLLSPDMQQLLSTLQGGSAGVNASILAQLGLGSPSTTTQPLNPTPSTSTTNVANG